jgi:D-3-phosphoglycerate dehydrogenase / 2-oxoglutarate reductase
MQVLFIDTVHPYLESHLGRMGHTCVDGTGWSRSEIIAQAHRFDGMVIRSRVKMDRELLDAAKQLKFIARAGAGMENIDEEYARLMGIRCINAPEGNRDAVGEHAIGMLLSLFNRINTSDREVRSGLWLREENRGVELLGRTVGIIGYGNTGRAFAKRLSNFGVLIYAYDKLKKNYSDEFVIETGMGSIFEEADLVSLHVPLTEDTYHLVNDEFFQRLHNPIYLINTSRGPVVDTAALVRAMESGKVLGACLDVLEYEKSSFEQLTDGQAPEPLLYLLDSPKVILTPHIAGWTHESHMKLSQVLAEKIQMAFGEG